MFKALMANRRDDRVFLSIESIDESDLMPGNVDVDIDYSTVNYKDALAITGKMPVIRKFPLIPGIDFSGTVTRSSHPLYETGDRVVLNGWTLSQTHHGGYAQRARVDGDWLVKLPQAISNRNAMAIGTAGYTAMLALLALERAGVTPDGSDILVTGASGGVGSVAIALLSKRGYRVTASTGRPEQAPYLKSLGATGIIDRSELSTPAQGLGAERWGAVIDTVGSHTLANAIGQTAPRGAIAACGLAQGIDLPTDLFPFLLRGVTLIGIDSVTAPYDWRLECWTRLAQDLAPEKLQLMTREIGLQEVASVADEILQGRGLGRVIVDVNRE